MSAAELPKRKDAVVRRLSSGAPRKSGQEGRIDRASVGNPAWRPRLGQNERHGHAAHSAIGGDAGTAFGSRRVSMYGRPPANLHRLHEAKGWVGTRTKV